MKKICIILHHTGTLQNPPVWGDEIQALGFKKYLEKKGIQTDLIGWDDKERPKGEYDTFWHFSEYFERQPGLNILWVQNDKDAEPENKKKYDKILYASSILAEKYNGIYFPFGFDPEEFYYEDSEKAFDVVFLGNNVEPRRKKLPLFLEPLRKFEKFALFGSWWDGLAYTHYYRGTPKGAEAIRKIYNASKIVMNFQMEGHIKYNIPVGRIFEGIASGSLVVSERVGEEVFKDIVVYTDGGNDLVEKVEYWLEYEEERKERIKKGLDFIKDHTIEKRVDSLLKIIGKE